MAGAAQTTRERLIADGNVVVELAWESVAGAPGVVCVQSFDAGDVSELGLRWLRRTLDRIDHVDRSVLERHLLLPTALHSTARGRRRGWLLAGLPPGQSRPLSARRTGTGDSIRSGLGLADQLAALFDVLERTGISGVDLNTDRCLVVDDGGTGTVVGALGASTTVDGVPMLLDAPPAANIDRFALARLVDHLLPTGIRDHPTLRDLRALERCWHDHHLSLPPAMWRTALEGAIERFRVVGDRPITIDIRSEPATVTTDSLPAAIPPLPRQPHLEASSSAAEVASGDATEGNPTRTGDDKAGLVGLTIDDLDRSRVGEKAVLAVLAIAVVLLTVWTLATI